MKKAFTLLMVLIASVVLAACGENTVSTQGRLVDWYELPENANYNGGAVTVTFWHRMGAQNREMLQTWIAEFKEIYPNITVNEVKEADDYNALSNSIALAIAAGNQPDIAESYPDHIARYAQGNAPLALNYFISNKNIGFSEDEIKDFLPGLWAEGQSYDSEGTILSLPFTKSSEALFYNKTYFDAHGYSVPETWDELFAIAEDIKAREENVIPFGYDSEDNLFITGSKQWNAPYTGFNEETGAGEVQFNNDESKEMVKYFKDKVDRGLMITRGLNGDAYTSDVFKATPMDPSAPGYAEKNKLYMYVGSTGGTRYAYSAEAFNNGIRVGTAPLPAKDADNKAQIQQGPNVNLFRSNDEQRMIAAWLFVKYITGAQQSAEFAIPSGYAPIRYSSYETQTWANYVASINNNPTTLAQAQDKLVKEAIEIFLNHGEIFFTSSVFNLSSKTRTEVGSLLLLIFSYQATSEADLDRYIREQYQDSYDFITN